MNKKVLTLCAGFLLAGGMLSVANASDWSDTRYVQNSGKYHIIEQTGRFSGSWSQLTGGIYLTADADGNSIYAANTVAKDENAYWTIVAENRNGHTEYQLINAKGVVFKCKNSTGVDVEWFLSAYDDNLGSFDVNTLYYYEGGVAYYIYPGTQPTPNTWTVTSQVLSSGADGFNNIEIAEVPIPAADLNAELNGAFQLNFKDYTSLEGNVFTGNLKAISTTGNSFATTYYLTNGNGDYILLDNEDVWSTNTANLDGRTRSAYSGYKFKTVSKHAFAQLSNQEKDNAVFTFYKSYDFNDTDSLIVTLPQAYVGDGPSATTKTQLTSNTDKGLRLYIANVGNVNYLTAIEYDKANDRLADVQDNAYPATTTGEAYEVGALAPYIELGANNMIDWTAFAGKIWNITDKDGNVLTPDLYMADIDSYEEMFAPAKQVDLTKPEGQWLLYKNNQTYYFVNRESGDQANFNYNNWTIRKTDTQDMYKLYWSKYNTGEEYTIYIREAKDAELGKTENGYVNFDMAQEDNNGKYLSFETSLGVTAYIGKDADDNVILTDDASKAIEFRVKQLSHDFSDHDGIAAPDTLHHYTSYLNKDLKQAVDTLQFFHYALYENFSEKYLMYDRTTKKFKLSDKSYTDNAHERFDQEKADYAFVVKEKEDGTYILVREYAIDYDYCNKDNNHLIYNDWDNNKYTFDNTFEVNFGDNAFDSDKDYDVTGRESSTTDGHNTDYSYADGQAHKAYLASQPGTLADMASLYNYNDNDRITMEATNKVEYMTITGSQDTVKIALKAQPNFFLYEDGTFLGMEHVADKDMKPAMFVDTAYVRNNTYRPQYLLAMNGKHVEPIWDNHPNSPSVPHLVAPDTTYGRFLINAVDSAKAWKGSVKTNPYIHEQLNVTPYYRLVFVDGYHTGDKLFLNTAEGKKEIALNNNDDKKCTFAFRYVDEAREGVKIETTYDGKNRGWLKYQNNVPVVTNDYEDAHVFTVDNTTTDAPTANEEISAGSVVVAGVNGAVVVKGAEGKNVIVSTILGKVVANEVVSSDNVTIAAPAGIVVVSVDGESFKVVVK